MNRLDRKRRQQVIAALIEGCSIRSIVRMTGVAKNTIVKLLADLGQVCDEYQDKAIMGVRSQRVQCDEIWSFCYAKAKNVPERMKGDPGVGDVWTWTAIDADNKLALTWYIGNRDQESATRFMVDVAKRVDGRIQLTTDGLKAYRWATAVAFPDGSVDFAQLIKVYAGATDGNPNTKYSPPVCTGARKEPMRGWPDPDHISTSFVERQNLTMRMNMRRFTRLTNAFSKKIENLEASVALHFMTYNFVKVHGTLKTTPAVAAGLTHRPWQLKDVIAMLEEREAPPE